MGENKIKLLVDYGDYGFNKSIPYGREAIIQAIAELIDDDVKQVIVKKEPMHGTSAGIVFQQFKSV